MRIRVRAPAKLNLGLVIRDRRPDGYHEIDTIFVPLRLFDTLELETADAPGVSLRVEPAGLPTDDRNLALRAAVQTVEALGFAGGVALALEKHIPVAAGLGGGSSDAAAAILGVEALAGSGLASDQRATLARGLGADVPFFLNPQPMRGRGVGELLEPVSGLLEACWVLCVMPFGVSTAEAYQEAAAELTLPREEPSIAALLGPSGAVSSPVNDLEAVATRRHPEIAVARRALSDAGARITGMSGSGPTVYGQFGDREAAERAAADAVLPAGSHALVVSSPGSETADWGWGVAKW